MLVESILGTVFGFLGTALTSVSSYKSQQLAISEKKAAYDFQLAKIAAESNAAIAEAEAGMKTAQIMAEGAVETSEANAFMYSQKAGNGSSLPSDWLKFLVSQEGKRSIS